MLFLPLLLLLLLACAPRDDSPASAQTDRSMITLHVDLQEGFVGDAVLVRVNGEEAVRRDAVRTKALLGYADTFSVRVPPGEVAVEMTVESRNISKTIKLQLTDDSYLGVSIVGQDIRHVLSPRPFGYG